MRRTFVDALCQLAAEDERIFLLTADLGYRVLEEFQNLFPRRFLNVGIAEQNLVGLATGLAMEGFTPFIYSMAAFITARCYEQLRVGPVLHRLPVRIIGTGAGFVYGTAGPTHYSYDDVSLMRSLPGMGILAPQTTAEMAAAVRHMQQIPGPVYLRIGNDSAQFPSANGPDDPFHVYLTIGVDRPEIIFLSWGSATNQAIAAVSELNEIGHQPGVLSLQDLSIGSYHQKSTRARVVLVEASLQSCFDPLVVAASDACILLVGDRLGRSFASEREALEYAGLDVATLVQAAVGS